MDVVEQRELRLSGKHSALEISGKFIISHEHELHELFNPVVLLGE
jgi:hypothetical protein